MLNNIYRKILFCIINTQYICHLLSEYLSTLVQVDHDGCKVG